MYRQCDSRVAHLQDYCTRCTLICKHRSEINNKSQLSLIQLYSDSISYSLGSTETQSSNPKQTLAGQTLRRTSLKIPI